MIVEGILISLTVTLIAFGIVMGYGLGRQRGLQSGYRRGFDEGVDFARGRGGQRPGPPRKSPFRLIRADASPGQGSSA